MPTVTIKVEGLADLERALQELPNAAAKATLRRTARAGLVPFNETVQRLAPVDDPAATPERAPDTYKKSWFIGSRLNARQARFAKREGKASVEVYAGTREPGLGTILEFGTGDRKQKSTGRDVGSVRPHPHARPAWDSTQDEALAIVSTILGNEIDKTATRLAAKAARLKG